MGKLIPLRVARWARGRSAGPELLHLEALVEQECEKVSDGYHYARWIVPLVGTVLGFGLFLPIAISAQHPLLWAFVAGFPLVGWSLGGLFHLLAKQISDTQLRLRKRCIAIGNRMVGFNNLLGLSPSLSPRVAEVLEEAARIYMSVRRGTEPQRSRSGSVMEDANLKVRLAMDEAMAQMLMLGEINTPQAQELELDQGWAQTLIEEMR